MHTHLVAHLFFASAKSQTKNTTEPPRLLKPLSTDQKFKTIVLKFDPLNPLSIIGEFIRIL